MDAVLALAPTVGIQSACDSLGVIRASFYRQRPALGPCLVSVESGLATSRSAPARALAVEERARVLDVLHEERFQDCAPAYVQAILLDEGRYLCSTRTMYRILAGAGELRDRREQRIHPPYQKPELLATAPNQLWSWDITRLKGPRPWTWFYLYVIMDVYSRYVVGYTIAYQESHALAKEFIGDTLTKQNIRPDQLTLHADRGSSMTSKGVALLLSDLGVVKTHSRPHVSNDNPYSESQFKTLKYRPEFPERFGTIEEARSLCGRLFDWYNGEHHHGSLALLTPAMVHHGRAEEVIRLRQSRLDAAHQANPSRFVNRAPVHPALPSAVYINPPAPSKES